MIEANLINETGIAHCTLCARPDTHFAFSYQHEETGARACVDCMEQLSQKLDEFRAAAPKLLFVVKDLVAAIDQEIEQRQHGGNDEDWVELKALSDQAHAVISKVEGRE